MEKLTFAVVGDLHVSPASEHLAAVIELINARGPDFVLLLGDLVDAPGDENVRRLAERLRRIDRPVYLTIGNHDTAGAGEGYDIESRLGEALPGPWSESFTYGFRAGGWRFVVLGMSVMNIGYEGPQVNRHKGYVSESGDVLYVPRADLERLGRLLEATGDAPACVVSHVPLVRMARRVHARGCYDQVRLLEEIQVLSLVQGRPNVKLVLAGHQHFNQVDVLGGQLHCVTQAVRGYGPYGDPDAIRMVELSSDAVRSWLIWHGREADPPAPIGTLEGDRSFEWRFEPARSAAAQ